MAKTIKYFEIQYGASTIGDKTGRYSFKTAEEAVNVATEFKNDPRTQNDKMSDENVEYWKSKTYTIVMKTIITHELGKI